MTMMTFDLAHKQTALRAGGPRRKGRPVPAKPAHRPSVALILLATTVQIIAMAALIGTVASVVP